MMRPASTATLSGAYAERPAAMTSALTNSAMPSRLPMRSGAAVDLPAPLGPAMTTRFGNGLLAQLLSREFLHALQVRVVDPLEDRGPLALGHKEFAGIVAG